MFDVEWRSISVRLHPINHRHRDTLLMPASPLEKNYLIVKFSVNRRASGISRGKFKIPDREEFRFPFYFQATRCLPRDTRNTSVTIQGRKHWISNGNIVLSAYLVPIDRYRDSSTEVLHLQSKHEFFRYDLRSSVRTVKRKRVRGKTGD